MIARRLAMAAIAASALDFGSACQAQQADTNCRGLADGSVHCSTEQSPPADPDRCAVTGLTALTSGCSAAEIKAANARVALRKQVGSLIASGHCDDAIKAALSAGDFDMADKAKGYCPSR